MQKTRTPQEVFNQWEREDKGDKMGEMHWQNVFPVLSKISESRGNYLEIGTGTGLALEYIAKNPFLHGQCYGLDVSDEMVMKCKKRFTDFNNVIVENADFLSWTPTVEHFDVIFSMEVFYYFPAIQDGLNKAFNLLSQNGELWVLVNFYKENETCHIWPEKLGVPMQLWSKDQYFDGFKNAGFTNVKQKFFGQGEGHDGVTLCTYGKK